VITGPFNSVRDLKEGDAVPLTLVLEGKDKKRETVEVKAAVRPLNTTTAPSHKGH
jgi:copper(I)-binding protein